MAATASPTAPQPASAGLSPPQGHIEKTIQNGDVQNIAPKGPRQKRPNYHAIHAKPLPLEVHPLPAFLPHNPLSFVRIAISLISHSIWPPPAHELVHLAYFSPETQSIHVTEASSVRALWEHGFFGAGSLSRSEPRWLDQEKRKRGLEASQTSEEWTRKVRDDRRKFKLQRAKEEREAIEEQLRREGKPVTDVTVDEATTHQEMSKVHKETTDTTQQSQTLTSIDPSTENDTLHKPVAPAPIDVEEQQIDDQEHLQLTFEEAFFLDYALGALQVYEKGSMRTRTDLFRLYCAHSIYPPSNDRIKESHISDLSPNSSIAPDNPFVLRYVVYHHFRSLGWVVRSGIKFAVDFLLYNRGPAFAHAEFAIMILPSYSHPYWSESQERIAECKQKETRDWWWLHRVNRVQTQVLKTLMLVYVEVPPPWDVDQSLANMDIGATLKKYRVREFMIRRWSPNRNRD